MTRNPAFSLLSAAIALSLCAPAAAQEEKKMTVGSGFFLNQEGYVLTANHVIEGCSGAPSVHGKAMAFDATVVAADPKHDLALLKILANVTIGSVVTFRPLWQELAVSDPVVVVGYPGESGVKKDPMQSWETDKIVSYDAKIINTARTGKFTMTLSSSHNRVPEETSEDEQWLEISHVAAGGNSGGPVLDTSGNVIGVIRATLFEGAPGAANQMSDIAVNEKTTRSFIDAHNVRYEETPSGGGIQQGRIGEIADAIVNIRCLESN